MAAVAHQTELKAMLPVLEDAHKKTPPGPRTEALEKLAGYLEKDDFKTYEPYLLYDMMPVVLKRIDDKPKPAAAAQAFALAFVEKMSIQAFPALFPLVQANMTDETKWKAKVGAVKTLGAAAARVESMDRDLLSASLPDVMPSLIALLYDTKAEVATAAEATLRTCMKGVTNRDLEPFIEAVITAMKDRDATDETIQQLAGIVFVQTVEGSALSVVIPLMLAGFRQPKALIKRICARIVGNMSKLVEEPLGALPFLGELIPSLFDAIDTIADPEARDVATKTHANLLKIEEAAKAAEIAKAFRKPASIAEWLEAKGAAANPGAAKYASEICASLIKTNTDDKDEFKDELTPYLAQFGAEAELDALYDEAQKVVTINDGPQGDDDEEGEDLCDTEFTLAYGTKILLHNARMRLKKGGKYGLLGQNDCGKTTLMRAIAEGSVDGFPDADEVKTVFVEADIQGELSHLNCVNYILEYPAIKDLGATEEAVRGVLKQVGFSEGKSAGSGGDCDDPISSLSGGWRMKLALARAMLQNADILLMDEPTNHLDVKNVKWVQSYINSLTTTTCIMVSHDTGLLDDCCSHILQIDSLKLGTFKGNLTAFSKRFPEAAAEFFQFKASKFHFTFPKPAFLDGVKSRGKALMKLDNITFTYPGNTVPTIRDISVRASMASRVACVGVNGAGKSTMIKVLTGELEPQKGSNWKYPNARIGYIAQHAFHHIESHLTKTPNEYIRWRFEHGDDREGLDKATMRMSEKDEAAMLEPVEYSFKDAKGNKKTDKRVIEKVTGTRRENPKKKKEYQYEIKWLNKSTESNSWLTSEELTKFNKVFEKMVRIIDAKIAAREQNAARPLTQKNVEEHINNIGLEPEYGTHFRIGALSGGQKVKVVLAAAMWDQPHILILDEPTNYLDRASLGALAEAIDGYDGGVIMITHNDAFCRQLCPERWVLESKEFPDGTRSGALNTEGDVEWMNKQKDEAVEFEQVEEMVDASGNEIKLKKKKLNAKQKKKMMKLIKQKIADGEDLDEEEEGYAIEWNL
jgi:elongation factor 3